MPLRALVDVVRLWETTHCCVLSKPLRGCCNPRCQSGPLDSYKVCSKCKAALYCGAGCQAAAWPLHRESCDLAAANQ